MIKESYEIYVEKTCLIKALLKATCKESKKQALACRYCIGQYSSKNTKIRIKFLDDKVEKVTLKKSERILHLNIFLKYLFSEEHTWSTESESNYMKVLEFIKSNLVDEINLLHSIHNLYKVVYLSDIPIKRTGDSFSIASNKFIATFPDGTEHVMWSPPWHSMSAQEEDWGALIYANAVWSKQLRTQKDKR